VLLDGKKGFFLQLGEALNQLLDATVAGIGEVQNVLSAVADRDLTVRSRMPLSGVFAEMRDDANLTADRLTTMLAEIAGSAEQIRVAAAEIAAGNTDLSARTEAQAANLEETAASMEELNATVKQNADGARQARQLAASAAETALQGNAAMTTVVGTMEGIADSSRRIESIIGTIDGIAFQTNILALNAAVEAARAGEQGRGFAVVASEVRALAQRSASAAREIKGLIASSVAKVDEGANQVHGAGETMATVVQSIRRVNDLMAEIAAASEEQAIGIGQVSTTVTQMDGATQQNAALVEETMAAAHSMQGQVEQLVGLVSQFTLPADSTATQRT
jgi:methyl-accepting chemotaxis protein